MTTDDGQESGSTLRTKLEAEIAKSAALSKALAQATVSTFKYVKAEDLSGVEPDQFATKAQEIEAARLAQAAELARQFLADKFGADVDLDSVIPKSTAQPAADDGVAARLASLGQLTGSPVERPKAVPSDPLEMIRASLDD